MRVGIHGRFNLIFFLLLLTDSSWAAPPVASSAPPSTQYLNNDFSPSWADDPWKNSGKSSGARYQACDQDCAYQKADEIYTTGALYLDNKISNIEAEFTGINADATMNTSTKETAKQSVLGLNLGGFCDFGRESADSCFTAFKNEASVIQEGNRAGITRGRKMVKELQAPIALEPAKDINSGKQVHQTQVANHRELQAKITSNLTRLDQLVSPEFDRWVEEVQQQKSLDGDNYIQFKKPGGDPKAQGEMVMCGDKPCQDANAKQLFSDAKKVHEGNLKLNRAADLRSRQVAVLKRSGKKLGAVKVVLGKESVGAYNAAKLAIDQASGAASVTPVPMARTPATGGPVAKKIPQPAARVKRTANIEIFTSMDPSDIQVIK